MAKTLLFKSSTTFIAAGTNYEQITGGGGGTDNTTASIKSRPAGTYSNLYSNITTNGRNGTTTIQLIKNGSNANQSLSIPSSTTGVFEDTSNTDSFADGDTINLQTIITGSSGFVVRGPTRILFDSNTDTVFPTIGGGSISFTTASTTRYMTLNGTLATSVTTESQVQTEFKSSATLKNFQVRVLLNARTTTTTGRIRKNAANGSQSVSIGNSATGLFENTANTDSIVATDKVNYSFTTGTGTQSITFNIFAVFIFSSSSINYLTAGYTSGTTQNFGLTTYPYIGASIETVSTESDAQVKTGLDGTLKNLTLTISANNINGSSTFITRKNTANGNQSISIGSSSTGFFSDTSNTTSIVGTDLINYQNVTGGSSGSMTLRSIMVELEVTAAAAEAISYQSYGNILQQFDSNKNAIFG